MFQLYGKALDVACTGAHYLMFVILGLMMSIPGPTLIDLMQFTNTDARSISFIFTARSIGYLVGSLTGGVILDCMKSDKVPLIISSLFVAMGAFMIPWCRNLTMLLGTFIITGFAMGFSNTGSNTCCLRIWGGKGAPFIQALHFAYGIGGFLAPVLAAPFLSAHVPLTGDLSLLGVSQNLTTEILSEVRNVSDNELKIIDNETLAVPTITYAYSIIGTFATLVCGCFALIYLLSSSGNNAVEKDVQIETRDPGLTFTIIVVFLACLQIGITAGVEVSFAQMLTSYVVKSAHSLSKVTGSYMTSVYWGAFTVTRLFCIPLVCKINVKHLLMCDFVLSVIAAVVLLTIGTWSVPALWAGTALLGIGVASIFPATLSWVEKYININSRIASVFTLVSSILEMTVPLSISMYLDSQPNVLFQFLTAGTISCCVLFVILSIILSRKGEKYVKAEAPEIEKEAQKQIAAV